MLLLLLKTLLFLHLEVNVSHRAIIGDCVFPEGSLKVILKNVFHLWNGLHLNRLCQFSVTF